MRSLRLIITCILCFVASAAGAQDYIGRKYWYEPSHEVNAPTDFYRAPSFNAPIVNLHKKDRIEVMGARRGWFAVRVESLRGSLPQLFVPILIFKARLYQPQNEFQNAYDNFMSAALFETDPDEIKAKLTGKPPDADSKDKASAKLMPWQKYKEKWGSVKPEPKKKYRMLDDTKAPENAAQPQ